MTPQELTIYDAIELPKFNAQAFGQFAADILKEGEGARYLVLDSISNFLNVGQYV